MCIYAFYGRKLELTNILGKELIVINAESISSWFQFNSIHLCVTLAGKVTVFPRMLEQRGLRNVQLSMSQRGNASAYRYVPQQIKFSSHCVNAVHYSTFTLGVDSVRFRMHFYMLIQSPAHLKKLCNDWVWAEHFSSCLKTRVWDSRRFYGLAVTKQSPPPQKKCLMLKCLSIRYKQGKHFSVAMTEGYSGTMWRWAWRWWPLSCCRWRTEHRSPGPYVALQTSCRYGKCFFMDLRFDDEQKIFACPPLEIPNIIVFCVILVK